VSLAPRPAMLAGREELLADLDARLSAGGGGGPRIMALHGLGGAGKTSVAVEYAHRRLAAAGVVWQFPAEDSAVLAAEFARLAGQLGVGGGLLDPRDPVASVHAVLAETATGWLLVFDNAPDAESVRAFLPPTGNGRVLITSQSALWPPGQSLEVPVLDIGSAAGFLTTRAGDCDEPTARELAVELGGLPLALEQAAAYVQATGDSLAGYLALFRRRRSAMLGRGAPTGYGKTVATTWALAFGRLEHSAPGAVGLLRLLACCAPEAVPWRLLLQPSSGLADKLAPEVAQVLVPVLEDPLAAKDAIAELRRYSLATPAEGGSVSVHRLVQAVTLAQLPSEVEAAWRQAAAALIEAALPDDNWLPANWPAYAALVPHAQAALAAGSKGMAHVAGYLGAIGDRAAALALSQQVLEARQEDLGPERPQTLTAGVEVAGWMGAEGDAAGARDQLTALLPVIERVLGAEHPATLNARASLAHFTGQAGDPAGARDQLAALLPVIERVLGAEHPATLDARASLALATRDAGDPAGARDQLAALLPIRERVTGAEHPATLAVRALLALFTGEAGDPAGARDRYAALLAVAERVLGAERRVLTSRAYLARFTGEVGDPAGARDQLAALLPVIERVLGAEHPATLATRADLGRWTGEAGDAASARDQFSALLPVIERVRGPDHPATLDARANLARWTMEAERGSGPGVD